MKSLLVMSEIALSFVLLIGAGLMIQSFQRMMSNEVGFDEENVISMSATLPRAKYPEAEMRAAFFREAVSRINGLPGVESAGAVLTLPFAGSEMALSYIIEGRPQPEPGQEPEAGLDAATASYFETMRIPLIEGRFIDENDQPDSKNTAVISEAMAREQWPDESPLGQRITIGQMDDDGNLIWLEIVGVVGDIRHEEMSEEIMPRLYLPHSQFARSSMTFVVRTTLEPGLTAQAIRRVVSEIDPEQPLVRYRLVEEVVQDTMSIERLTTMLTGGFAEVALFLASIGLFGVMSYSVKQRVREIGIRMALGAQRTDVLVHFMKQGVILTLIGVVIGLIAAYGLTGLISSQLYQVTPSDPMTFIVVAILLTVVAMFACFLPARRATKIDPMTALRYE